MKRAHSAAIYHRHVFFLRAAVVPLFSQNTCSQRSSINTYGVLELSHWLAVCQCATNTTQATTQFARLLCDATNDAKRHTRFF